MLNQKFFQKLLEDYQSYYRLREEALKVCRVVLRSSKQAIFSLHRDNIKEAKKNLDGAENLLLNLEEMFKKQNELKYEGFFNEAAEEFVEAKMFYEFLISGQVDFKSKIKLTAEQYLGGVCDLTGEILRKTVQTAASGELKKIPLYQKAIDEILGELIKFDLVGKLRSKYDEAKRNLKRAEEILYEIKIRQRE